MTPLVLWIGTDRLTISFAVIKCYAAILIPASIVLMTIVAFVDSNDENMCDGGLEVTSPKPFRGRDMRADHTH